MQEREVDVKIGQWTREGWDFFKDNLWQIFPFALIWAIIWIAIVALSGGASQRPTALSNVITMMINGAMICTLYCAVIKRMKGGTLDFNDLFEGFKFFVPALLANLFISVFFICGTLLCIIPGIIVQAAYAFTFILIVDRKMHFWDAMETSRKAVFTDVVGFCIYLIAKSGIIILGILCCGIGIFVAIPVVFCIDVIAYRYIFGFAGDYQGGGSGGQIKIYPPGYQQEPNQYNPFDQQQGQYPPEQQGQYPPEQQYYNPYQQPPQQGPNQQGQYPPQSNQNPQDYNMQNPVIDPTQQDDEQDKKQ